jgi:hypothetical protein
MSDDSGSNESQKDPGISYLRGLTFGNGAYLLDDADPVATTIGVMQKESGKDSTGNVGEGIVALIIAMPFIFIFGSPFFEAYFITKLLPGFLDSFRIAHFLGTNNVEMGIDFDLHSSKYVFVPAKYYYYYIGSSRNLISTGHIPRRLRRDMMYISWHERIYSQEP